jgi:hypothetical protein
LSRHSEAATDLQQKNSASIPSLPHIPPKRRNPDIHHANSSHRHIASASPIRPDRSFPRWRALDESACGWNENETPHLKRNMETVYIESTIPSYLTARHVAREPMAFHQQLTKDWWNHERVRFRLYSSIAVRAEISSLQHSMFGVRCSMFIPPSAESSANPERCSDTDTARRMSAETTTLELIARGLAPRIGGSALFRHLSPVKIPENPPLTQRYQLITFLRDPVP